MAHPLVVISDTKATTGHHTVVEDYNTHHVLCRFGVWVGCATDFVETVKLSYEHDPDPLYVGWALNGTVVSTPGFPPTIFPPGNPVPGVPDVRYTTPVDGLYHRISLTGTSGMPDRCIYVQVLYTTYDDIVHGRPVSYGPAMTVCLSGQTIEWPADKLAETRDCLKHLWEILHKAVGPVHVNPGDPVETWLARATPEQALQLKGYREALERLDINRDAAIHICLLRDLRALLVQLVLAGRLATPTPRERGAADD
jgi:hypothetical protein